MSKALAAVLILLMPLAACGNRTSSQPEQGSQAVQESPMEEPLLSSQEAATQEAAGQEAAGQEAAGQEAAGQAAGQEETQPRPELQPAITMSPAQTAEPPPTLPGLPPSPSPATSDLPSVPTVRTPVARTPAPRTPTATPPVVQPSRSLAGHDRFLVSRPFGSIRPADFELGLLFDRKADPSLGTLLNGLARALTEKSLKTANFSSQALMLAELLYNPDLVSAPGITRIRFSKGNRMPGAAYSFGIRLFSEKGEATGLAILGSDDEDNWVIEHLDLDLRGLREPRDRSKPWDPYGYSRNLFD